MTKAIRLKHVVEAAGLSHGTASNVFNRPELVREKFRERAREAGRALGYPGSSPVDCLLRSGKVNVNVIGIAAAEPLDCLFFNPWPRRLLTEVGDP